MNEIEIESLTSKITYADDLIDRLRFLGSSMTRYGESVRAAADLVKGSRNLMLAELHDINRNRLTSPEKESTLHA